MRVTVICPEALLDDANQLAMALGQGSADGETFRAINWWNVLGNRYACASYASQAAWVNAPDTTVQRPAWDTGPAYAVNMAGARRAQAALWIDGGDDFTPMAAAGKLVVVAEMNPGAALVRMGLSQIETEDV